MKKIPVYGLLFALSLLVLSACAPLVRASDYVPTQVLDATPQPMTNQPAVRDAQVESVEILYGKADPAQVSAVVRGSLSDSCTALQEPQVSFKDGTFTIKLSAESPTDRGCVQITSPYEQAIALDTANLPAGSYTVVANGVSASFNFPSVTDQSPSSLQLVVLSTDGNLNIANVDTPLNPTARLTFNAFLPYGGGASGNAYVLLPEQGKAVATDGKTFHDLPFVQAPSPYGLAVWPGGANSLPLLAWATHNIGGDQSSTIKVSAVDGTQFETLLTQDAANPPTQLVVEFWSADGQWLYFSKEPVGLGGYILFSGGSNLFKINVATQEVVVVFPADLPEQIMGCLDSISSDFRYIAEHCSANIIRVRDLTTGGHAIYNPPASIASGSLMAGSARFSPDGKKIAYADAKSAQDDEQGWVVVTDTAFDNSKVIMSSQAGSYYTIAGWLDEQTLLVQSTNPLDCSPYCKSELWTVKSDGTEARKVADGSFLAMVPNDAYIQLPAEPPPTPAEAACTDAAKYVGDDGLDGTTYAPNTAFTKAWTVKNSGTCTWDSSYLVYQISGAFMTQQPGYWLVAPGNTVEPGQNVDIHVGMTSPPTKGNYQSYWGLKNAEGEIIPIDGGADGNSFYVEVKVNDGSAVTGAVTATSIDIVPEQGSGDACKAASTYFVHAYITTDGPTTASYEIGSTAGQIPAGYFQSNGDASPYLTGTMVFDRADTKAINLRFVGPYPYPDDITVSLRVNDGEWINTKLYCP